MMALAACLSVLMSTAAAKDSQARIEYEDGSYAIVTIEVKSLTRAVTEETKTYTYYNSSGQRCFSYTLLASFTYNGKTSSADSTDFDAAIYRQGWDIDSHDEYTSGNTAYGEAVFSGPNGEERPVSLKLTCDRNGNVT